ncbi:nucleolar and coiled-body phosphoprotein 1-like [Lolium rigidum]|uniref:nucleolar and coiled-body phosphoprotein 1-like n=1 Tax=Lolium rigidum TaxID=89674 RepID=UPI001F5E29E6|nr:nucleolar and coiled-body phosphoprotein 1-like [Lolium rigidum]XP_051193425.1 uncharacterized protein LOC127306760 [Lolium perenne]
MANYDDYESNLMEDEYDDLDDFIVGSDNEGEEEELPDAEEEEQVLEEEQQVEEEVEEEPPVGVQEILSIREQLKAKYRKQHLSAGAGTSSCSPPVQEPARSRFGTFFGPSTPALAPRLIEAGSSSIMREIQNVPSRRDAAPSSSKSQPNASDHEEKPKILTKVKRKVDTLRENRDYSNLFSDDADTPAPPVKEEPESKPVVSPKTEVEVHGRPMQPAGKNNQVHAGQPTRTPKDHGSVQARVQSKVSSQVKKPLPLPNGRKTNPSVSSGSRPSNVIKKAPGLQASSNGQNLQRPLQSKRPQASPAVQKKLPSQAQRPPQGQRQQNHVLPSSQVRRVNTSVQSQQQSARTGSALPQDRQKMIQKRPVPSLKPKPSPASAVYNAHGKTKVGLKRKLSEEERVRQLVRETIKYNPAKYAGRDEDDRNMVAGFASIQMEERRSAKLGRKEDQEQLLMIQEEERRERAKKKKKQPAQS